VREIGYAMAALRSPWAMAALGLGERSNRYERLRRYYVRRGKKNEAGPYIEPYIIQ
jgi:hypothetical protein